MHPTLLHVGRFYLSTFSVFAALGLTLALTLSLRTARLAGLEPDQLWNAGSFTVLAAFLLSRLLLILTNLRTFFHYPLVLLAVPSLTPTALSLTALATLAYLWRRHMPLLRAADAWASPATLLWAFLALGHFFEGSDPGLPAALPWATHAARRLLPLHPVALYAATLALLITLAALLRLSRSEVPGETAALALSLAGLAQFLLSFLRVPAENSFGGLDPLQLLALGMLSAGLALFARTRALRQRQ